MVSNIPIVNAGTSFWIMGSESIQMQLCAIHRDKGQRWPNSSPSKLQKRRGQAKTS